MATVGKAHQREWLRPWKGFRIDCADNRQAVSQQYRFLHLCGFFFNSLN